MAQSALHLTQSKFYSPAFNAAVFDGPIRIYFAQHQEGLALKVYSKLQQHLKETYSHFRKSFKYHGQTIFLMLYLTQETFDLAFGPNTSPECLVSAQRLGDDHVVGVCGPLHDDEYESVFNRIKTILDGLDLSPLLEETVPSSEAAGL